MTRDHEKRIFAYLTWRKAEIKTRRSCETTMCVLIFSKMLIKLLLTHTCILYCNIEYTLTLILSLSLFVTKRLWKKNDFFRHCDTKNAVKVNQKIFHLSTHAPGYCGSDIVLVFDRQLISIAHTRTRARVSPISLIETGKHERIIVFFEREICTRSKKCTHRSLVT